MEETDLSYDKKKAIQAARNLCYGQDVVNKLLIAKSVGEINIIMVSARKKKFGTID